MTHRYLCKTNLRGYTLDIFLYFSKSIFFHMLRLNVWNVLHYPMKILIIIENDMVKGQAFFNQLITGMYSIFSLLVGTFLYLCICQARRSRTNLITIHLCVHVCDYPCAFISVFSLCTKSLDHPPFILSTSSLTALILSSLAFFTLALYPFISLSCYHLPTPTAPLS